MTRKVLQINLAYYLGGSTGKIVEGLANAMREDECKPYVIYGINRGEKPNDYSCLLESRTYKRANELLARIIGNHGFNNRWATQKAIRIIKKIQPDLVHLHNLHGSYINLELLFYFLKQQNIPVVWTLHDCWAFTGRCACYDFNNCSRWKDGCGKCTYKKQYPMTYLFDISRDNYKRKKEAYRGMDNFIIIVPSKWLKHEMSNSMLKDKKIYVINNGIDLNVFKPRTSNIKEKYKIDKLMLAVSYMWPEQKGYKYLLDIAKKIKKPWKLAVIGVNKKQKVELQRMGVIALERIGDGVELAKWYSTADVFINPTLEDNFPTVNIEAIACGTPCVTFNTGGAAEIVNNKVGKVVEKGDWKSLMLFSYEVDKNTISYDCVKEAVEKYDMSIMYKSYLNVYNSLLFQD